MTLEAANGPEHADPIGDALASAFKRDAARALLAAWRASRDALEADMRRSRARTLQVQAWIEHYVETGELPAEAQRIATDAHEVGGCDCHRDTCATCRWDGFVSAMKTRNEDDFPLELLVNFIDGDLDTDEAWRRLDGGGGHTLSRCEEDAARAAIARVLGVLS